MKLLLLCFLVSAQVVLGSQDWDNFKKTHGKVYKNSKEESYRKQVFLDNLKRIEEHNKKYEQGLSTYSVKVNKFADMKEEEIVRSSKLSIKAARKSIYRPSPKVDVPESIDWRDFGVITPVKDQSSCEACWAFAIAATVEAHTGIYKNKKNISVSEQNLIDCADPTFQCYQILDLEIVDKAYEYIANNNGVDTFDSYPYQFYTTGPCQFNVSDVGATISGYAHVTAEDEEEMKTIVGTVGPVSAIIIVAGLWYVYDDGVYYEDNCMAETVGFNHVVSIVGYGTENGQDYWLAKNSWGTWFGQDGYIKMARNRDNNCGIASYVNYPLM